jgi:hypothetical protein
MQLYRYFMSQSSEFCRYNRLCCFSTSVCCCLFPYRPSPGTFGYTLVCIAYWYDNFHRQYLCIKATRNKINLQIQFVTKFPCFGIWLHWIILITSIYFTVALKTLTQSHYQIRSLFGATHFLVCIWSSLGLGVECLGHGTVCYLFCEFYLQLLHLWKIIRLFILCTLHQILLEWPS